MLTRIRDDERGIAMVIALLVSMVLLTLATVVVAQSIHDVEGSGRSAYNIFSRPGNEASSCTGSTCR